MQRSKRRFYKNSTSHPHCPLEYLEYSEEEFDFINYYCFNANEIRQSDSDPICGIQYNMKSSTKYNINYSILELIELVLIMTNGISHFKPKIKVFLPKFANFLIHFFVLQVCT